MSQRQRKGREKTSGEDTHPGCSSQGWWVLLGPMGSHQRSKRGFCRVLWDYAKGFHQHPPLPTSLVVLRAGE